MEIFLFFICRIGGWGCGGLVLEGVYFHDLVADFFFEFDAYFADFSEE